MTYEIKPRVLDDYPNLKKLTDYSEPRNVAINAVHVFNRLLRTQVESLRSDNVVDKITQANPEKLHQHERDVIAQLGVLKAHRNGLPNSHEHSAHLDEFITKEEAFLDKTLRSKRNTKPKLT